jgi:hypothetical protein
MRYLIIVFFLIGNAYAEKIPPKSEMDNALKNMVKQFNSQMPGLKVDEYTTLKFVTYDTTPPLLTYFYSTSALTITNQQSLTNAQLVAMNQFNINKTCTSNFKIFMKHYNLKVAHMMEDNKTGKNFYKLTVTHADC